jgi:predicted molibdopterin-dependent oxidoreductase YjgC
MEYSSRWTELPDREVSTICPYCGVGCQLNLQIKDNKIIKVVPSLEGLANNGQACIKGKFGLEFVNDPSRLTSPLIKKDGEFTEATWDEALDLIAEKLKQYTSDQVAVISSAKCTSEDNYVIQKFTRAVLGTNTVDHCARL